MRDLVNYASVHPVELESSSAAELKAKKSISGPFSTFSRRGPETAKVNFHYSSSTGSRLTTLDAGPVGQCAVPNGPTRMLAFVYPHGHVHIGMM